MTPEILVLQPVTPPTPNPPAFVPDVVSSSAPSCCSTHQGLGKRIGVRHFSMRARGCLGLLAMRLREGDSLAFMGLVGLGGRQPDSGEGGAPGSSSSDSGDIVAVSREGLIQRNAVTNIALKGRYARGASLMRLQVRQQQPE